MTKLNATGTALVYSTHLGGSGGDYGFGIAVDATGDAYVTGKTTSTDFPTANLLQPGSGGGTDAFVSKLNPTGASLVYSSYLGGSGGDSGSGIALDAAGNAYVTGGTVSTNFPTVSPLQFNRGSYDAFVAKIFDSLLFSVEAIVSNHGGNSGDVSVAVLGAGFQSGATIKLRAAGQPDIEGANPTASNSSRMTINFDLRGSLPGPRDVVVTLPDSSTATLRSGFTIEQGGGTHVWVDIVGRDTIRIGRRQSYSIVYGNRGNTNAYGVLLWIGGIPKNALVTPEFRLTPPQLRQGQAPVDWNQIPIFAETSEEKILPLWIPLIQPGSNMLSISITIPSEQQFQLKAWMNRPFFERRSDFSPASTKSTKSSHRSMDTSSSMDLTPQFDLLSCIGQVGAAVMRFPDGWDCIVQNLLFDLQVLIIQDQIHLGLEPDLTSASWEFGQIYIQCAELTGDKQAKAIELATDLINVGLAVYSEECSRTFARVASSLLTIRSVTSRDPNDKVGSHGVGGAQHISGQEPLRYTIFFENVETATGAAQDIVISDQLDIAKVDLSTFSFGSMSFGGNRLVPPPGLSEYTASVDLRPKNDLIVNLNSRLNKDTGLVTWKFTSIDPTTGLPTTDPLAGFLPPNVNPPEGDGSVMFTVNPKTGLSSGTVINNAASIVFDSNAAIQTPTWSNTLDNSTPSSSITALTATPCSANLNVQWSGTDIGSGIRDYTIYVSNNGGPFTIWQRNTTATSGTYAGQFGHTYAFHSVAQDNTGNIEIAPPTPDATVTPSAPAPPIFTNVPPAVTVYTGQGATLCGAFVTDAVLGTATAQSACSATNVTRSGVPSGNIFHVGNTTIAYTATDVLGNATTATQTVNVLDNTTPAIACPANIVKANDSGQCAAVVTYANAKATDNCSGVGAPTCSPATGSSFPKGITTVTCSVVDVQGNTVSCSFTITVTDTQPPVILCPANFTVNTVPNQCSAVVTYPAPTVTDNCSGAMVVCAPPSSSTFPIGATTISCTATDAVNSTATCAFTVRVNDTQAPTITMRPGQQMEFGPPNHQYETVRVSDFVASASDTCSGNLTNGVVIASISSDEPDDAPGDGDGNTTNDIVIAANCRTAQLRVERQGSGNGRVYTITFRVRDAAGNVKTAAAKVSVPKNQNNNNGAVDDGPAYTVTSSCS